MLVLEFLLLAAAIAQASKIISEGYVFEWLRKRVTQLSAYAGEGISCQLCVGTWAGLLAAAFAPEFIHIEPGIFAWFADGMALGFAGRLLYSVQEAVLASSFWLERGNHEDEDDTPPPRLERSIPWLERPFEEVEDGQSLIETSRLIESEAIAPVYETTPQDWEDDWRDLPDEVEELA